MTVSRAEAVEPYQESVLPDRWLGEAAPFDVRQLIVRAQDGSESVYDEPLVTDRPDFTEASSTVGRSVLQFEMGYTFIYNDSELDGVITRAHSGPEMLMRYGLTESAELRLIWNYAWESTIDAGMRGMAEGAEDLGIGTKIFLTEQEQILPESSIIFEMTAPTGSRLASTQRAEFGMNLLYSWELPNSWSLAGSSGYATETDVGMMGAVITLDRANRFHQSVALGVPITEKFGWYFEYFGLYFDGLAVDAAQNYVNGGFTYLLTNNLQFDIRAGKGLNDAADDLFAGSGVSVRY